MDKPTSEKCPTRLIEDLPADKDKLAYNANGGIGPYERVTKTVLNG